MAGWVSPLKVWSGNMYEKAQTLAAQRMPHAWDDGFSVANDKGRGSRGTQSLNAPQSSGRFRRFILAAGAFAFFAGVGGILTFALPFEPFYQARILAVMPQSEGGEVGTPSMDDVASYAKARLTSDEARASAKAKFGEDRADLISVKPEHEAPVLDITTTLEDPAVAQETVNYFADILIAAKQAVPGADGARRALLETLHEAKAELAAFEVDGSGEPAETLRLDDADPAQLQETAEAARERALAASKLSLNAVLTGKASPDVMSPTLLGLVEQYMQAKAEVEALSDKLGPLHPQFVAAKTYLAASERRITDEIARIVKAARAEIQSAAAAQMKADKSNSELATLNTEREARRADLQAAVDAAQANLDVFDRSLEPLPPARFRMISPATRIEMPYMQSDLIIAASLALGLIAALIVFVRAAPQRPTEQTIRNRFKAEPPMTVATEELWDTDILDAVDLIHRDRDEDDWQHRMPRPANDEEVQTYSPEVRALAMRLAALRKRAEAAAEAESQPSIEEALAEMRRLRSKVQVLAKARNRHA